MSLRQNLEALSPSLALILTLSEKTCHVVVDSRKVRHSTWCTCSQLSVDCSPSITRVCSACSAHFPLVAGCFPNLSFGGAGPVVIKLNYGVMKKLRHLWFDEMRTRKNNSKHLQVSVPQPSSHRPFFLRTKPLSTSPTTYSSRSLPRPLFSCGPVSSLHL